MSVCWFIFMMIVTITAFLILARSLSIVPQKDRVSKTFSTDSKLWPVPEKPCIIPPASTEHVYFGKSIFSVADLHGDFNQTIRILLHAGLIGHDLHWAGGDSILVQTGDIVDRGDHARKIYDLFSRLKDEAHEAGGMVLQLLGNHEVMNILGNFKYVSRADMEAFGGRDNRFSSFSEGEYSYLANLPTTILVNDTLFAHAGIDPLVAELGLDVINDQIKNALKKHKSRWSHLEKSLLGGNISPIWTRNFEPRKAWIADYDEEQMCEKVEETLGLLGANRMVIGHNVQRALKPRSRCNGMLLSMDCGISDIYGGGFGYLKISDVGVEIMTHA